MPNLIAALVASVGLFVGSLGPWVNILAFNLNGADINLRSGWGGTLTLGAVSAVVLFTQLNLGSSGTSPSWLFPLLCAVPVCGVVGLIVSAVLIVRARSLPAADLFGRSFAFQIGWGLWMVAAASALLCITAWVIVDKLVKGVKAGSRVRATWFSVWQVVSMVGALAIVAYTAPVWNEVTTGESVNVLNLAPAAVTPTAAPEYRRPGASSAPTTSSPPTAANGALLKQIGQQAAFTTPEGILLDFVVTDITLNDCRNEPSLLTPSEHGAFIVIDVIARTHSDVRVLDWGGTFSASNWQVIGPDGYTDLNVDTLSGYGCGERTPQNFSLNSKYSFAVVLDSKYSTGQLVFKPIGDAGGWVWDIP